MAIHPPLVIVRSKATWQSTPTPVIARSKATWQSIFRWCKTKAGLLRLRLAMTVSAACNEPYSCHCEEQSDVAIHISGSARRKLDCFACGSQ